jgi:antitoxin (DNA-binding transcriptional repressor) of toxin-antitoxin stability system
LTHRGARCGSFTRVVKPRKAGFPFPSSSYSTYSTSSRPLVAVEAYPAATALVYILLYTLFHTNVHYRRYVAEIAMKQATFTELRSHAKHYFDLVEAGETVRVLRNGKPIADILPVQPDTPSWKRRQARPLVVSGAAISRMILAERESEL